MSIERVLLMNEIDTLKAEVAALREAASNLILLDRPFNSVRRLSGAAVEMIATVGAHERLAALVVPATGDCKCCAEPTEALEGFNRASRAATAASQEEKQ
jgi:hypothetical protein